MREPDALAFASRRDGGARAHGCQHAHRHCRDLTVDGGKLDRAPRILGGNALMIADDVVPQVLWVEPHHLRHHADMPAHIPEIQVLKVAVVEIDRSARRPLQPEREPEERALARPGLAGDRDELARTDLERHVIENQRPVGIVAERDVVEDDIAAQHLHRLSFGPRLGSLRQQGPNLIECGHDTGQHADRLTESDHRRLVEQEQDVDDDEVAHRKGPGAGKRQEQHQHRSRQQRQGSPESTKMHLGRPDLQFRALLLAVVARPDRKARALGPVHAQLGYAVDELEQPPGQPKSCPQPTVLWRNLAKSERHGRDERQQSERQGHPTQRRIAETDQQERR